MINIVTKLQATGLPLFALLLIYGCGQPTDTTATQSVLAPGVSDTGITEVIPAPLNEVENSQFNIGNTRYLFDVSDHSAGELEALLARAEAIREAHAEGYDDLEIVLVLHGPDINIFRQENYARHKSIVDLAARLDAFDIIDMKICETTMTKMGVERSEVPSFIESVPYAPAEIRRLADEGYINL